MKRTDILRILQREGFEMIEGGNHTKLRHPDGRMTILGRHREIPTGTVRAIEKQTKVRLLR